MIISDLSLNEKDTSKIIKNIGDTFEEDEPNNTFSLSTIRHQKSIWIITSYYYDKAFKIYNYNGDLLHKVNNYNNEYIISLEGLFFTEENTYICVRTPTSINLYINEYFIKQMKDMKEDSYLNFKIIKPFDLIAQTNYIIITVIKNDLSLYIVQIIDIFPIFPLFTRIFDILVTITFGSSFNKEVHIPMNEEMQKKISQNKADFLCEFWVNLDAT